MVRFSVISDTHANLPALRAVKEDMERYGPYDFLLHAGDVVGYGPYPNEVIEEIRRGKFITIAGNHDVAVVTGDSRRFNDNARAVVKYTREVLKPENMEFLRSLKTDPYFDGHEERFAMVHGSFEPGIDSFEDVYIDQPIQAVDAMAKLIVSGGPIDAQIPLGIVGHTHIPMYAWGHFAYSAFDRMNIRIVDRGRVFEKIEDPYLVGSVIVKVEFGEQPPSDLLLVRKALLNPGSVGQPRNKNPAASYCIVEIDGGEITFEFRAVKYDIAEMQDRMRKERFPLELISRLEKGT